MDGDNSLRLYICTISVDAHRTQGWVKTGCGIELGDNAVERISNRRCNIQLRFGLIFL
jgi:hypothetical protein